MKKPNFLVVGAAKSGTTTLDGYLKQNPNIFLPETKESRYFSCVKDKNINPFTQVSHANIISDKNRYYALYEDANCDALGDISPDYLFYHEVAIKKIKEELGSDVKIIIILRNPVDRAYSNYLHLIRDDLTKEKFKDYIDLENKFNKSKIWYGFFVIGSGFYYDAVKNYINNFHNVKVIIFEEFIKDCPAYIKNIENFIGVDCFDYSSPEFTNKTGVYRYSFIRKILKNKYPFKSLIKSLAYFVFGKNLNKIIQIMNENNLIKPKMDLVLRNNIKELYKHDIKQLEKLLKIDLSIWK